MLSTREVEQHFDAHLWPKSYLESLHRRVCKTAGLFGPVEYLRSSMSSDDSTRNSYFFFRAAWAPMPLILRVRITTYPSKNQTVVEAVVDTYRGCWE